MTFSSCSNCRALKVNKFHSDMAALSLGIIALVAFLAAGWWFSRAKTRDATKMMRWLLGGGAVIAGIVLSLRGAPILGGPIGLAGLGFLGLRLPGGATGQQTPPPQQTSSSMSVAEALETLGLDMSASEEDVHAAHRRLMKKLHPDTGEGSAALARQVQEAKDVLLQDLQSRR